jgi:hypothetical protein
MADIVTDRITTLEPLYDHRDVPKYVLFDTLQIEAGGFDHRRVSVWKVFCLDHVRSPSAFAELVLQDSAQ